MLIHIERGISSSIFSRTYTVKFALEISDEEVESVDKLGLADEDLGQGLKNIAGHKLCLRNLRAGLTLKFTHPVEAEQFIGDLSGVGRKVFIYVDLARKYSSAE